jgi:membrane protein insertase Oxa1/YidC/SpoIIIJ
MLMMPVVLTVMLSAAPGGLNLYWLASNTCSIIQQAITMRLLRTPESKDKGRRR